MTTGVSIIGCGWLGQALASQLIEENIPVAGSYQSSATKAKLNALGIDALKLVLPLSVDTACNELSYAQLFQQNTLVIAIPPQLKKGQTDYPRKVAELVDLAEQGNVEKIIFLNSTAIYNGLAGEVDEQSELDLKASKVQPLLAAEQAVRGFSKQSIILRLAGLVGPKRHPGKFLQLKREFASAKSPVNLVHQSDVVNIIKYFIAAAKPKSKSQVFNVVSNTNCTREHYYQTAAYALQLPRPEFKDEKELVLGKKVQGKKLIETISYHFQYDDLLQWVIDMPEVDKT